jgi:hypothetical protein
MVVAVYKKSVKAKKKYMKVFMEEQDPDKILNSRANKPLIPNEYIILEVGIGEVFIEIYKKQHKIKNHETIK